VSIVNYLVRQTLIMEVTSSQTGSNETRTGSRNRHLGLRAVTGFPSAADNGGDESVGRHPFGRRVVAELAPTVLL
jgi:hypothetical protein